MKRLLALCALIAVTTWFTTVAASSARLLVLDFELIDTSNEPIDRSAEHARRLVAVRDYVSKEIAARKIYEVADDRPVRAMIDDVLGHQYLGSCNGCELSLAREAGAEFVLLGKFNKVSTLIGSMQMQIENAQTGKIVYARSFDYRGDTDEAWMRAAKFFVEELSKSVTR